MTAQQYNEAVEDLERHEALEASRRRAGIETDMHRWLHGGEVRD